MSDNIKVKLMDSIPDEAIGTIDSDQEDALLILAANIQVEIDHNHGISQSKSDLLIVS